MNSNFRISPRYRSHLWNAGLLLASVAIALAADQLSAAPRHRPGGAVSASPEVAPFVAPLPADPVAATFAQTVAVDPFDNRDATMTQAGVASGEASPSVPAAPSGRRRLTAILIADERRVAVIDEKTVSVGDVLRDGARVSTIQPDRVWVVEKNGRWQMLTLTSGGQ